MKNVHDRTNVNMMTTRELLWTTSFLSVRWQLEWPTSDMQKSSNYQNESSILLHLHRNNTSSLGKPTPRSVTPRSVYINIYIYMSMCMSMCDPIVEISASSAFQCLHLVHLGMRRSYSCDRCWTGELDSSGAAVFIVRTLECHDTLKSVGA